MRKHHSLIIIIAASILLSCSGKSKTYKQTSKADSSKPDSSVIAAARQIGSYPFPYDLSQPSEKYKLPEELVEISGIDVYKKNKLVCVQDEKGNIYEYDVKKGELKHSIDFGKKGDYEGIANVNDTIYVL